MNRGIRISEKHGVNPSISVCFFCGKEKNELLLLGRLPNDEEAPRKAVFNHEPCDECKEMMEMGIMLISVKDNSDKNNPYKTGKMCVIKEEAAHKMFNNLGKSRVAFIEDSIWEQIGLPIENKN